MGLLIAPRGPTVRIECVGAGTGQVLRARIASLGEVGGRRVLDPEVVRGGLGWVLLIGAGRVQSPGPDGVLRLKVFYFSAHL